MAGPEKVKSYQRTLASGKTVTVSSHQRVNEEAATESITVAGRPPIAAKRGQFPGGRSLPGVWVQPPKPVKKKAKLPEKASQKSPKSLPKPRSKKTQDVVSAAAEILLSDTR